MINTSIVLISLIILANIVDIFTMLAGTESNGLLSRYGTYGILKNTISHIIDNIFMGDGIGYTTELIYTDSGYTHGILIYGLVGSIIFYIMLYIRLMQKNLVLTFLIFVSILFFEIGYDMFFYTRTLFLFLILLFYIDTLPYGQQQGLTCKK